MSDRVSVIVVGAGVSGLACALALHAHGVAVQVLEKSRGMGGRMSARREDRWRFEHGAPHTPALASMRAAADDIARPLPIGYLAQVHSVSRMSAGWEVRRNDGVTLVADVVVLAIPAPQAVALLDRGDMANGVEPRDSPDAERAATVAPLREALSRVQMAPCWSVMLVLEGSAATTLTSGELQSELARLLGDRALRVRAQTSPHDIARHETAWVVQLGAAWSTRHLDADAQEIEAQMAAAVRSAFPTGELLHLRAHRWRYAHVTQGLDAGALWLGDAALGACGDWGGAGSADALPEHEQLGAVSSDTPNDGASERAIASGRALAHTLLSHYNLRVAD